MSTEKCAKNNWIISLTVPKGPPYVSLKVSPEFVRGGDNINVTCAVLGEPEEDVNFSWTYPGQVNTELGSKVKPSLPRYGSEDVCG